MDDKKAVEFVGRVIRVSKTSYGIIIPKAFVKHSLVATDKPQLVRIQQQSFKNNESQTNDQGDFYQLCHDSQTKQEAVVW